MERLKKVIEQYARWSILTIYTDRIEAHFSADFSQAVENAKALLEAIGREICKTKGVELKSDARVQGVLKKAFASVGYAGDSMVTQISTALTTIGQKIGELRNDIGATAHGKSLEELKERNSKVDILTREFLIDTTVVVAIFLIRCFENENPRKPDAAAPKPIYPDFEDFNDYWDDLYGEFAMGEYSFPASEVLFHVDNKAYMTEQKAFAESDDGTDH